MRVRITATTAGSADSSELGCSVFAASEILEVDSITANPKRVTGNIRPAVGGV
jgi:hypothetical protein